MKRPKEEENSKQGCCSSYKKYLLIISCLFVVPFLAYKLKQSFQLDENLYGYDEPAVELMKLYGKYDRNSDGVIDMRLL